MKKLIFAIFVTISTYAVSDGYEEVCREYSDSASLAMYARQNGIEKEWFLSAVYREADLMQNKEEAVINMAKHLSKVLIDNAYSEQIKAIETEKEKAISDFSVATYQRCMSDVSTLLLPVNLDNRF